MEDEQIKQLKEQHIETYKKAILENIKSNTKSLVNDDISYLINKPPLDSMDLIRNKFLDLAKKNKIVLNTEKLDSLLDSYRKDLSRCLTEIENKRIDELSSKMEKYDFLDDNDIVVFYKKDFVTINKSIKNIFKEQLSLSYEDVIMKKVDKLFSSDIDNTIKEKVVSEISKYIKGSYQKQLLESLEIKILVKDTTLINGIKEQTDRYLFTIKNSRLLNLD